MFCTWSKQQKGQHGKLWTEKYWLKLRKCHEEQPPFSLIIFLFNHYIHKHQFEITKANNTVQAYVIF